MNQMAEFCERVGANIDLVRKGIGTDERIGPSFLFPGPGYGGSCFPKDVKALVSSARTKGLALTILDAVESTNERQKRRVFEKLSAVFAGDLPGKRIAVWGLAFKANTDDMRESPALTLIEALLSAGATVVAHDPVALAEAKRRLDDRVQYAEQAYDALRGADALAIMTDWNEYRHPDFDRIRETLRQPIVVDGRNLYDSERMQQIGFRYFSIGRGTEPIPAAPTAPGVARAPAVT
jgi:UDPglucose 6-dehydrogenase